MAQAATSSKRKRAQLEEEEEIPGSSASNSDWEAPSDLPSDSEIDISNSLLGKKPQKAKAVVDDDDDAEDLEEMIRTSIAKRDIKGGTALLKKSKGRTKIVKGEVGGGSFQSMGLHPSLFRSLTMQGYRIPTPIQRLAIPPLLASPPRDLVGMARTGSGKTLAYMIPLVQRLSGRHATAFGARALILVPARELALQVMKVGKELARGWSDDGGNHAGDAENQTNKKGLGLRWGLIVGGEGMDEQFEMITNNPDVIIATPGRLLHLAVEMNLDLRSVQYIVFDEADRLFEMGFETALNEIIHRLPSSRQTLLFSATLPKSLVEFAKAGLENPKLVRLDSESKISTDLRMAFFSVKQAEKDACLLVLLRDVIQVPFGSVKEDSDAPKDTKGKGKAKEKDGDVQTAPHQTLVFVATKHHVEYVANLLTTAGYAVSHIYGALDQVARSFQMDQFRRGQTNILVVTDVAARGIDIPVLENVVNYDFPQGARVFVHRVGRTARAGRRGWAWSFVTHPELPHLLDLQLFLGRPIKSTLPPNVGDEAYTTSLVLGHFDREMVDADVEYVRSLDDVNHALPALKEVMRKGQGMYERSQGKASQASYKRAKEMVKDGQWGLAGVTGEQAGVHPILLRSKGNDVAKQEGAKNALIKAVNAFRPAETVFEVGSKGKAVSVALMKDRRKALSKAQERAAQAASSSAAIASTGGREDDDDTAQAGGEDVEMADESDLAEVFDMGKAKGTKRSHRDSEFYMSYHQKDANTEKGYSLKDGSTFQEQVKSATFDLLGDDAAQERQRHQVRWDTKKKKFIKGDGAGADNVKIVKTESGTRLPATYRSGRFDEWKAKNRRSLPKVGEAEPESARNRTGPGGGGKKWKHTTVRDAKPLDKFRADYDRKSRQLKKRGDGAGGGADDGARSPGPGKRNVKGKTSTSGRYGGKPIGRVRNELKSADQIRKSRAATERKKAKNARPSRKGGKKMGRR